MNAYHVYADGRHHGGYSGFVSACTTARRAAFDRPGVEFMVERASDLTVEATFKVSAGTLRAWVR